MRALLVASLSLLTACGGRVGLDDFEGPASGDGAISTDTSSSASDSMIFADTGSFGEDTRVPPPPPPTDGGPPPPYTCEQPIGAGFKCSAPKPIPGKKVCTDVAIRDIANGCFGFDATESSCAAARKKWPACNTCMLNDWLNDNRLAIGACIQKVAPGNPCATTIECTYSCLDNACSECDWSPGSGKGGGSEMDDCWETAASGQCFAVAAKDYEGCISDPKTAVCVPDSVEALLPFYRGACRDGGDWSKANIPDSADAGGPP